MSFFLDHYRGNLKFAKDPETNTARLQDIISLLPFTIQINDFVKKFSYTLEISKKHPVRGSGLAR